MTQAMVTRSERSKEPISNPLASKHCQYCPQSYSQVDPVNLPDIHHTTQPTTLVYFSSNATTDAIHASSVFTAVINKWGLSKFVNKCVRLTARCSCAIPEKSHRLTFRYCQDIRDVGFRSHGWDWIGRKQERWGVRWKEQGWGTNEWGPRLTAVRWGEAEGWDSSRDINKQMHGVALAGSPTFASSLGVVFFYIKKIGSLFEKKISVVFIILDHLFNTLKLLCI